MHKQPALGVTEEMIVVAETQLGVRFPEALREVWKVYNCNEMRGGWRVFPIFDSANARKTAGSISYENLKGVWGREVMSQGFLSIADNGSANQLVLKIVDGLAGSVVFHWHHETQKLTLWRPGIAAIKQAADKSCHAVLDLQQRFRRAD